MFPRAILILAAATLLADPALATDGVRSADMDGGIYYRFDDDPLEAMPNSSELVRIRVRPRAQRSLLVRPRTEFVSELRKSVEDL